MHISIFLNDVSLFLLSKVYEGKLRHVWIINVVMFKIEDFVKQQNTYLKRKYMGVTETAVEAHYNIIPYYIQNDMCDMDL